MEEKIIVKSELFNIKKFWDIMKKIGIGIDIVWIFFWVRRIINDIGYYNRRLTSQDGLPRYMARYESALGYALSDWYLHMLCIAAIFLVTWAIGALVYKMFADTEMIITDKRVYGMTKFGRRVDLPLDSISAIGTSAFKGLAVTTASGAIKFGFIKNRDLLHSELSKLLVERQGKAKTMHASTEVEPTSAISNADELKKFKELLDMGVITQEEFDAKKKQLLGL